VVTRTTTLLTITSGLLVGLVGYSINRWDSKTVFDPLLVSAIGSIIYLLVPAAIMCFLVVPTSYSITGAPPKPFFSDIFFNDDITKDKRLAMFYANEIVNYQVRITLNLEKNQKRWKRYTTAFLFIALSPLAFIIIYLIATFLASPPTAGGHSL
jgi:hypothetical protein